MNEKYHNFIINNIKYDFEKSKENTSSRLPAKLIKNKIKSAYIICNSCGHEFYESNFRHHISGFIVICKKCKNMESIPFS